MKMGADHDVGAPRSRGYWRWWVLWLPAAGADLHGCQRFGCCERGGEERQERRASKMKVTAGIHQVAITILHRALRLGNGCTAAVEVGAQNVTTIQRLPQIDFSKNRKKRMEPKEVAPDSEMGRRPICRCLFAALGSIREVHHLTHRILASKMEQMPFVGAVYGKMTRRPNETRK